MDRDIASFNRPIMDRIYAKNLELHQKRLKTIKKGSSLSQTKQMNSTYHCHLPQPKDKKGHFTQVLKKQQIEKQNAKLFKKMMNIMKRPDPVNNPATIRHHQSSISSTSQAKNRISLQFSRINEENRHFYHRLEKQKPTIDNKKLQEERNKNLNILKFLGKYPNQTASRISNLPSTSHQQRSFNLRSGKANSTHYNSYKKRNDSYGSERQSHDQLQHNKNNFKQQMSHFDVQLEQLKYLNDQQQRQQQQLPARRKFLSQGMKRVDYYRQKGANRTIEQRDDEGMTTGFERNDDGLPLPYNIKNNLDNYMPPLPENKNKRSITYEVKNKPAKFSVHPSILLYKKTTSHLFPQKQHEIKIFREADTYKITAQLQRNSTQRDQQLIQDDLSYLQLCIPQDQGTQFLSHYDYEYKKIVSMLVVQRDDLNKYKLAIEIKQNENIKEEARQHTDEDNQHEEECNFDKRSQQQQNLCSKHNNQSKHNQIDQRKQQQQLYKQGQTYYQEDEPICRSNNNQQQSLKESMRRQQQKIQNKIIPNQHIINQQQQQQDQQQLQGEQQKEQQVFLIGKGRYEEALNEQLD